MYRDKQKEKEFFRKRELTPERKLYRIQYAQKNKEKIREKQKKYWEKNKERLKLQNAERYKKNRESRLNYAKSYYWEHRQESLDYKKNQREKPETRVPLLKRKKEHHERNKDKINRKRRFLYSSSLDYRQKILNREKFRQLYPISKEEIEHIINRDECCVYCHSQEKLGFDHIIPISKGGLSNINNLVLACSRCNHSKNDADVLDWCKKQNIKFPEIINELQKK